MLRATLSLLFGYFYRVQVTGHTSQLARGRPLVVANHDSLIDALLVALFLPGRPLIVLPRVLAGHPVARLLRRVADCAEPGVDGDYTIKGLVRVLRSGRPLVVFPQDRVTTTGSTMKIYGAAAVIAARADADIVPLRIGGTLHTRWSATSCGWPRRLRPRVTLAVQPSVRLRQRSGVGGARRQQQADELLCIMQHSMASASPRQTLFGALVDAAVLHGRRTRVIEDLRRQVQTYGDLLKGSLALGRLTARFTEPGERVGVLLPNIGATVCLVFGLASRGRVAAMLNYSSGVEALRIACTAAGLRTIITSRAFIAAAHLEYLLAGAQGCRIVYLEDLRETMTLGDKQIGRAHV